MPVDIGGQVVICMRQERRMRLQDTAHLGHAILDGVAGILETLQRAPVGRLGDVADVVDALGAADGLLVEGQDIVGQAGEVAERRQGGKVQRAVPLFRERVVREYGVDICFCEASLGAEVVGEAYGIYRHKLLEVVLHVGAVDEFDRRLDEHR